jgi:hypothetical protein
VLGVQRSAAAPLPPTRADGEAKTELLRRTTSSGPRRAPVKKRSLAPLIIGAVVLLGGAGAAVALRGGGKRVDGATPTDATTRADTLPTRDTVAPRPPATRPSRAPKRPLPVTAAHPGIDVARARELLDSLLEKLEPRNAEAVRDFATRIFDTPGITVRDKAYAAYVVGLARFQPPENDRTAGCRWIRTAALLDSSQRYRDLLAQCQR